MLPRPLANLSNTSTSAPANRSSTSLITPSVSLLSSRPPALVDAHLFEYLMTEVLRMIDVSESVARDRRMEGERIVKELMRVSGVDLGREERERSRKELEEEREEGVRGRLDAMGFKVGWALGERLARDRPRFPSTSATSTTPTPTPTSTNPDPLEVVKFICKDLWIALYDKQIDNLRTNHRGVYVLQDNSFKPLTRLSGGVGESLEVGKKVKLFLAFPCGIIRGALATLGIPCTVTAESSTLPQSTFQIKTLKSVA